MRKSLILLVILILLCSCAFAERINALSFCEMYIKRLIDYETSMGTEIQDFGIEDYSLTNMKCPNGAILTDSCGGSISVNTDDMSVETWCIVLTSPEDDSEVTMQRTAQAALAISVLEYNSGFYRYIDGITSMEKAFIDILQPVTSDPSVYLKIYGTRKEEKIYEGNYTYYLDYFENEGTDTIVIFAE